ncbi:flagellar basal body rod protein FlgC [Candidatus Methylospira mobilis]|uniref:Flagellar basal-body rod protein FlgC n=1 Tax=Candidatus Methylospira mobilis TaxID=1808979 RepID=A0A5Q0BEX8_9GAMM|nr:flagellar basal body rod protein FlgC [Candidatus Methylospira mobilis]QFY42423.1 flagellar basal body rod protein FlgC [Candidatus Methylospira mobilis]WNV04475.1 flagellar basal body rod protein FlgC [Candidatus Methylospira mobilis]
MSSLLKVFDITGSAMISQSKRLNTVASNLANAETVAPPGGTPYKAKHVVFTATPLGDDASTGVTVEKIVEDSTPPKMVYNPGDPSADANGFVSMANINVADEMVDMISASRSYQTNVEVMNAAKSLFLKTLTISQ